MSTSLYEDPTNLLAPAWEADADFAWSEADKYKITRKKIESQGEIAPYIASSPREVALTSRITATTLDAVTLQPQRLVDSKNKLQALAAKKQPVLVINPFFEGYLGIENLVIKKTAADGHSFTADITLVKIERTVAATTTVPASKLKPKVKKRAAAGAKGGAAKGRQPTARERTKSLAVAQKVGLFK